MTSTEPDPSGQVRPAKGATKRVEFTRAQKVIAQRMAQSRSSIPDFTLRITVDMEAAVQLRTEVFDASTQASPPSLNDIVVKACATALVEFPQVNASYGDGCVQLHERVNVGFAVSAPGTLIVPVVVDADVKPLDKIAAETRVLAGRVRSNTLRPEDIGGGTFTVSNLGMFGIEEFEAVVNPPQAAILAVGAVVEQPVVRDGEIVARRVACLSLSCDHRVLYGADAAQFLRRLRELLESPHALAIRPSRKEVSALYERGP